MNTQLKQLHVERTERRRRARAAAQDGDAAAARDYDATVAQPEWAESDEETYARPRFAEFGRGALEDEEEHPLETEFLSKQFMTEEELDALEKKSRARADVSSRIVASRSS